VERDKVAEAVCDHDGSVKRRRSSKRLAMKEIQYKARGPAAIIQDQEAKSQKEEGDGEPAKG